MKKALLTTTALVAFAGAASAEVSLSGYAEMGIIGGDGQGNGETRFHHDFDVKFSLSGETDNGLTFGATIDLDEVSGGISNEANPSAVFISGGFGTLTMGDTDGAFDWAMQEVGIGTSLADDHTTHVGFALNSGLDGDNDGQVLRYDNTFGDFGIAISAELDDAVVDTNGTAWGLGLKYNAALGSVDLGLGLAMQTNDNFDIWGVSIDAKFGGGFRAILNYSDLDGAPNDDIGAATAVDDHIGIGLGYTSGALTVSANYGEYSLTGGGSVDGVGVGVNYDLGGGAVVMAGYGSDRMDGVGGLSNGESWSIGLGLSF